MEADGGDRTIAAYEAGADRYAAGCRPIAAPVQAWLDAFTALLPASPRVLEIGSGTGADADRLERSGAHVQRSDAASSFLEALRARGHDALRIDVRRDPLPGPVDGVLANAVLLHLDRDELDAALRTIAGALSHGGVLACSLKEGDGEEWHERKLGLPRRFTYWREAPLRERLAAAGFVVLSVVRSRGREDDWLHVLGRIGPQDDRRSAGPRTVSGAAGRRTSC